MSDDGDRRTRNGGAAEAVVVFEPNSCAGRHISPECLMLNRESDVVAAGFCLVACQFVSQRTSFAIPIGGQRDLLRARSGVSLNREPVGLIARVMSMEIRATVVGKIEKLKRRNMAVELRRIWRVQEQVCRLLPRRRESIRCLMSKRRRDFLRKRHATNDVAPIEEGIHVGPAERGLPRRTRLTEVTTKHGAK